MTASRTATLCFSDRPQRVVGHLTTKKFVEEWGLGENSFAVDPPNAVILFAEKGDATPEDAIVVIKDPQQVLFEIPTGRVKRSHTHSKEPSVAIG